MISNNELKDFIYSFVENGTINKLEAEVNINLYSNKGIDISEGIDIEDCLYINLYKINSGDILSYNGMTLYGDAFVCEYDKIAVFDYKKLIECKMLHKKYGYYMAIMEVDRMVKLTELTNTPFIIQKCT